ncbi:MAG: polyprenyl synthetase family protein [Anaerolineae bacterium]|jgi:geranylgeranyl diphosphate synthase type I|nr:polyprenyl synthetase family protein [Anaerolineae bacterium]MBT3712724.1 polyprenyl synthetase family protein [Anaerolineae bacterium]MBT4311908.1 polyprenyl synthetase family protein [Anaerolineae bacterium]MBT4459038.1 polyprenyl synthetase family protein [Anaerolineae bacterium]MBT4841424.1 polyprenyl synthetase family protein [Anaerolineae bacterium]
MENLQKTFLDAIEKELHQQVARLDEKDTAQYHEMLTYHMGWTGEGAGAKARGKRIRPLLLLLATSASGGDWEKALPAAAGIELVHNFSLLHDDIQDNSATRRGRLTAWKIWGVAQAINAGDGMFILANLAMGDLATAYPAEIVLQGERGFQKTCLDLTRGQHLDIDYETREDIMPGDYWTMIAGKTAALLSTSMYLGALFGGADEATQYSYKEFGHYLGLAFQVQDDLLGIWGDEALTGKSTASDLLEGKKSLPVLYGLEKKSKFAERWGKGALKEDEIPEMAQLLEIEGARLMAQRQADQMTDMALNSLRMANPQGEAGDILFSLAERLLGREA